MFTDLQKISTELRETFPNLSEFEIAQLAMSKATFQSKSGVSVKEMIDKTREIYWAEELNRIRAKIRPDGTMREKDTSTYRTHNLFWKRLEAKFGSLDLSELKKSHIIEVATESQAHAKQTRDARNRKKLEKGLPLIENTGNKSFNACLEAISVVLRQAMEEELLTTNITTQIKRKRMNQSSRHGLTIAQTNELFEAAIKGGNDPILDYIILWTLAETACRSGGLLKIQLGDINIDRNSITFYEKGSTSREQPISEELRDALIALAESRGAKNKTDAVFRFLPNKDGISKPMSARRFDTLWGRLRKDLDWVAQKGVSCHWLRHTTLTWVDRAFNQSVARAYAGHSAGSVTDGYTTSTQDEIKRAHAVITGKQPKVLI